jgi:protein arginine N-methyltransferase 5
MTRSDTELTSTEWIHNFIGKISDYLDLDSEDKILQKNYQMILQQELSWANHLSLQMLLLPTPRYNNINYARVLQQLYTGYQQIHIKIPLLLPLSYHFEYINSDDNNDSNDNNVHHHTNNNDNYDKEYDNKANSYCKDGWIVWDHFRQHFGDHNRLFIALELTAELLEENDDDDDDDNRSNHNNFHNVKTDANVKRWIAEPISMLIIPTSLFLMNNAGYPILPKQLQHIVKLLIPYVKMIMFTGKSNFSMGIEHANNAADDDDDDDVGVDCGSAGSIDDGRAGSYTNYIQYIKYLRSNILSSSSALSDAEKHVSGYEDVLQAPLQPLMDNLEAQVYETFERDPMKYVQYEAAIKKALVKMSRLRSTITTNALSRKVNNNDNHHVVVDGIDVDVDVDVDVDDDNSNHGDSSSRSDVVIVVTVVGAGRGPLVDKVINASRIMKIPVRIYAVEKNPNAIITLRNRQLNSHQSASSSSSSSSISWKDVIIIEMDMRIWQPSELSDIMVSELLGSFGDNELSPECLDGAERCCLKSDGISIPHSYTSFISPIATSNLWNQAKNMNLSNSIIKNGLDTAFVVKLHRYYSFGDARAMFHFHHPNRNHREVTDNQR